MNAHNWSLQVEFVPTVMTNCLTSRILGPCQVLVGFMLWIGTGQAGPLHQADFGFGHMTATVDWLEAWLMV